MDVKYIPDTSRETCSSEMLFKKKDRTTELHTRLRFLYDKNNSSPTLSKSHKRNGCYETLCSFTTGSQSEGTSVKIVCATALDARYNNIHTYTIYLVICIYIFGFVLNLTNTIMIDIIIMLYNEIPSYFI